MIDHKRKIQSFVRRAGRITKAQQRGLTRGFERYGLKTEAGPFSSEALFHRQSDIVLEVGFGMGEAFFQQIQHYPEVDFIGVEVHAPGVGRLLNLALEKDTSNLAVYFEDVNDVLEQAIPERSLTKVQLFFPDPWPKKRHHKRRLVTRTFIERIQSKLKPDGMLHMATDWVPYADQMKAVMSEFKSFQPVELSQVLYPRFSTRFERRGENLGHQVIDCVYKK
jgi:tRNA (guanine-N7-)-methyltransferase